MFKNKILKNASWIIVCRVVQSILSLLITMLTSRYLGPSNFGLINYAAALVSFVAPIAQLGLGSIQVQELINFPEDEGKITGTMLVMSLVSSFFCSIGVISFATIANRGEIDTIVVSALYSIILFFQAAELMQYWYQSKYLSKYASITSLVAFIVISIYKVILLSKGLNVYWFAIANSIDYIIISVVLIFYYRKLGGKKLTFSFSVAKRMYNKSKYYIIANMMIAVFSQTDRIMIKQMLDSSSTGLYSAAVTAAGLANFVYMALIDSFRPLIFESYNRSKEEFEINMSRLYFIVIYLSLFQSMIICAFSKFIMYIIYGIDYISASTTLAIVSWYTVFSFIGSVRNIWLLANGKHQWIWKINVCAAIANVLLNLVLIPSMGINGAAIASLLTQFLSNVIITYLIKDIRRTSILMFRGLRLKNINQVFNLFKNRG